VRLAYLYPEHLGRPDARVLQVAATCRALAQSGVDLHLICGWFGGLERRLAELGLEDVPGLKRHGVAMWQPGPGLRVPFSWGGLYQASAWNQLRRLAGQGLDAVLVRHLKLAAYLLPRVKALGLPLIFEAHEFFSQTAAEEGAPAAKTAALEALERRVLLGADRVIAISQPLAQALEKYGAPAPVLIAPSGVDESFFNIHTAQREYDLAGYAGGLGAWKGVDLLLEAAALVPELRLEVLGGKKGGADWQRLKTLAARLDLGGRLVMRPRAGQDAVRELLARAGIAVWPGTGRQRIAAEFTSPLKLFEYLAAGCAVIAPKVPAAESVLTHGQDALLFEPDDAGFLADALRQLTGDGECAKALSRAGRQLARKYTWRARAEIIKQSAMETGS
jgi:glycosyltransferase involved in cell wall biosynthesis